MRRVEGEHWVDRLHPVGGVAGGFVLGVAPAGLMVAGYVGAGAAVGVGVALAGLWWGRAGAAAPDDGEEPSQAPDDMGACDDIDPIDAIGSVSNDDDIDPVDAGPRSALVPETPHRPALVRVDAGTHAIGDRAERRVTLTRGYLIAETPVTQAQYTAVMGQNPSWFQGNAEDARRPVEQVSWLDAVEYCNRLSALEGLAAAYTVDSEAVEWDREAPGYRLPTEAEWEVAARARTTAATYAGELEVLGERNAPVLDAIAWYGGNSGSTHPRAVDSSGWAEKQRPHARASTQPVKGKRANAWGLYDVLGNVWEWTWDWHDARPPAEALDPAGPPRGGWRVFRGGSFNDTARRVRAAYRNWRHPDLRFGVLGFRPVRSAPRAR